ncbi:hypothetical protein BJ875DRAFT_459989 [Amylocarpus encephaloides]|uniref:Uncharacterized protein n=1 Tax=Amylocarpus encephaloides TaxID=45428 RepID=A0A9P8C5W4_9HELO|nr:hypothetical protein BJ875DRAFT_459989 [Amylocarpus encephaloides]
MDAPPSYTTSSHNQNPPPLPSSVSHQQPTTQSFNAPRSLNFILPSGFGVYSAGTLSSDMVIAHSADASKSSPLFYISVHSGFSSQPSVVLHSQAHEGSPPMATAELHSFSSSIDIDIFLPDGKRFQTKMKKEGTFTVSHYFQAPMSNGGMELFEWKSSSGAEVASLNGRSHGKKLVRSSTGQVVAAWTGPTSGSRKKGKMSFMGGNAGDPRAELGTAWELIAIISHLALAERARRARNSAAAGGGAAGGG